MPGKTSCAIQLALDKVASQAMQAEEQLNHPLKGSAPKSRYYVEIESRAFSGRGAFRKTGGSIAARL